MANHRSKTGQFVEIFTKGVGVAVLKGAVMYGLDPGVITTRRAKLTYGIGVIVPFKVEMFEYKF